MEYQWHTLVRDLLKTGLTQRQLAAAIGVTQGAVSQVLNAAGKRGFGFHSGNALLRLHAERCFAIERATGGLVTRGNMRPDVDGQVIRANPRPKSKPRETPSEPIARSM